MITTASGRNRRIWLTTFILLLVVTSLNLGSRVADAQVAQPLAFERVWAKVDKPVAVHRADRAWVWGPGPYQPAFSEPYILSGDGAVSGSRLVQYYDKGRMELPSNDALAMAGGPVSTGLLAKELITGRLQVGDDVFERYAPADINVAGDIDDLAAPTYASFAAVLDAEPIPEGWVITQTLNRLGEIGNEPSTAGFGVSAAVRMGETNHNVASVFWNFLNQSGQVYDGWEYVDGRLFDNPFALTGFPISEAYWTTVKIGGESRLVLVQAFERRILTFTPGNAKGWDVESANVGQHYYSWRYGGRNGNPFYTHHLTHRLDSSGNWLFLGDVRNDTRSTQSNVRVTIQLFDGANEVIASESSFLDFSQIEAGENLPFRVWFNTGADFARYQVDVTSSPSPTHQRTRLTMTTVQPERLVTGGYRVVFEVQNQLEVTVSQPAYVVVLRDSTGAVVDYNWSMLRTDSLEPGATVQSDVNFFNVPEKFVRPRVIFAG